MTEAIDILNSHNIRPSVQRIAILKYLLEHRIHPTVDDIYLALNPTMPTLSKTTVYNVLRNLVENGAVLALTIDEKNVRYDADISSAWLINLKILGVFAAVLGHIFPIFANSI